MLPEMLVRGLAAEAFPADPTQVSSTHRAAEVTSAHPAKMSATQPAAVASTAAPARKRIGRNACASHRYGGNDSVQNKFPHGNFLSS